MSIKLICIDMDGTLLKDKKTVSEENLNSIKLAIKKGVKVVITTGRIYDCAKMYSEKIGLDTPIIASNGAFIGYKDKVIYNNPLKKEDILKFLEVTKKHGLKAYLTANFGIISQEELAEDHVYKILNKTLKDEEKVKLIVSDDIKEEIEKFDGEILKGVCADKNNKVNLIKAREELESLNTNMEIVSSWNDNFEVMRNGSTKGDAVRYLANYFGIDKEEVMCIGDSENDLSMIKYAGTGVAMGNASEDIKSVADYVTDTNVNDGVAKAINKFVLKV
ncbi:MAG: Cof-type HAD-IIB family hydrolase [Clostridium baratii]|uniref:Cof-like hydrolase family protein n=1 Tax=Clostridium baratii str. Sullivan TaxID=1415775 RepID=A0A0A7G1J2_9CLOT|nr:Cof-type HAD-IIB family hydrolase [Clostridium baratii]AIY84846.1 Cof-like hydrolase family protein [Clostridium baratii str. Sullivan]MBS6006123.1 Cof-type HAD-IIB family hydrolase [Clostridium baratii]MDU1053195.1 Cof-type HAD-IIB family hydrolase [Clostridium baratii]MDU4911276.1 Cof-type HAD-IIB family hydrolase [Clostridium baratii]CUP12231.1 HAD family hydrolase [Clostridium baratii]